MTTRGTRVEQLGFPDPQIVYTTSKTMSTLFCIFFKVFDNHAVLPRFCGDGNHFEDKNKGENGAVHELIISRTGTERVELAKLMRLALRHRIKTKKSKFQPKLARCPKNGNAD